MSFPATVANRICNWLIALNRLAKMALMVSVDLAALPCCFLIAMLLRVGNLDLARQYNPAAFAAVAALTIAAFALADLYRAVIRYIDQRLLIATGLALALAALGAYLVLNAFNDSLFPRSALAIYWFIAFSYVVSSRLAVRNFLRKHAGKRPPQAHAVAIYGAGDAGAQLAFTMRNSSEYRPVCFFDEKRLFKERSIGGLRVFHTDRLVDVVNALCIRSIIIAIDASSPERLRTIQQRMGAAGVTTKILSRMLDLADERSPRAPARAPSFEDLLGRAPVPPSMSLFAQCVRGRCVLVTGAGGSIGSELCRQIVTLSPARLHLLDHSEFALYTIKQELLARFPHVDIVAHLGSVCTAALVERILQDEQVHTIYHAAAYKHVPLVETNIVEGLRNNVVGAQLVAAAVAKFRVSTCVLISSDKAVRPGNIMGASKRIAELIFQAAATRHGPATTFSMVRFGNVLGSSGSVIPLFQRQIAHGGPLTITHPDVERYFMLISEAAQLVIQAGAMAKGGDVFVLDMGLPMRIVDLARRLIALSGLTEKTALRPDGDIEIQYIGLFPGEKLAEELLTEGKVYPSEHPRIARMKEDALRSGVLDTYITFLMTACDTNDRGMIESMVKAIVTEYTPQRNLPAPAPLKRAPTARKFISYRI